MMIATYKAHQNCQSCLDLGWLPEGGSACVECNRLNTHEVQVLQLGVGFFGNKAVVQDIRSKQLFTVGLSELKNIQNGDDRSCQTN